MTKPKHFFIACFCAAAIFGLCAAAAPMTVQGRGPIQTYGGAPAPTPIISFAASEPYRSAVLVEIPEFYTTKYKLFSAIPPGKRFVIEHVSVRGFVPTGQKAMAWLKIGGFEYAVVMNYQVAYTNGKDCFSASQQMKLYVDDGESLYAYLSRGSSSGLSEFTFSVSGYLIDAQ